MKLLICTPGRTGSGVMAKFLHKLGKFKFTEKGTTWVHTALNSGYEDSDIFSPHTKFKPAGYESLKKYIKKFAYADVVKDPRFTNSFNKELMILKAWYEVYPGVSSLFLYRKPIQVVHSHNWPVNDKNLADVEHRLSQFVLLSLSMNRKFGILLYPNWLEEYDSVYKILQDLDMKFDYEHGKKVFNEVVDLSMVHSTSQ